MSPDTLIAEARSWLGTPFRHLGRAKGRGVDCVGLVMALAAPTASDFRDLDRAYPRLPERDGLRLVLDARFDPLPIALARPGDVALLAWKHYATHCALLADGGEPMSLIHAWASAGKVVEHRLDPAWAARLRRAYRVR